MEKKEEIVMAIYRLDMQLYRMVESISGDGVMHKIFPKAWEELKDYYDHRPKGDIRKKYNDKHFVKSLHHFFKRYDHELCKDVRSEKHSHHGIHKVLKQAVSKSKELLDTF